MSKEPTAAAGRPGVRYELHGAAAVLLLSNPARRNAFMDAMREDLEACLLRAGQDAAVRVVVIAGDPAGGAFCAGGDIHNLKSIRESGDPQLMLDFLEKSKRIIRTLRELPKPVIAAVEGAAAGAGCNLALACDLRVAAEDAVFIEAFIRLGLVLDWAGTWMLPRLVGPARAAELAYTGKPLDARTALAWGLVNRVTEPGKALEEALAWARELATRPRNALAGTKHLLYQAERLDLAQAMTAEQELQARLLFGDEAGEGITAFLEKRPAVFP